MSILEYLREHRTIFSAWIIQMFKFSLVGVLNTLIDAGAYFVLTRWLWLGALPVLAKGISYTIGMLNSFYWNRNWTFKSPDMANSIPALKPAFLFTLTNIAALGINAGVMYLGLDVFHFSEIISLALATVAAFGWNFVLSKRVVFRN